MHSQHYHPLAPRGREIMGTHAAVDPQPMRLRIRVQQQSTVIPNQ